MVTAPRLYPVSAMAWVRDLALFLEGSLAAWLATGVALASGWRPDRRDSFAWLAVTAAVTTLLSAVTEAKLGGRDNCMIPAWFAVMALAFALLRRSGTAQRSDLVFVAVSCALLVTALTAPAPGSPAVRYHRAVTAAAAYRQAVGYVRGLGGVVMSPEDPTIALIARGQVGPSIFAEYDAAGWPKAPPARLLGELRRADHVVDNVGYWNDWLKPETLAALGFRPEWTNGAYTVWGRASVSAAPAIPGPAPAPPASRPRARPGGRSGGGRNRAGCGRAARGRRRSGRA
jgi:hypothetical protein